MQPIHNNNNNNNNNNNTNNNNNNNNNNICTGDKNRRQVVNSRAKDPKNAIKTLIKKCPLRKALKHDFRRLNAFSH